MSTFRPSLVIETTPESESSDSRSRALRALETTRRRVALENRLAADAPELDPRSPHLRLAGRVAGALEGAVLPPERRAELVAHARDLGVREFDANLVIAVIQDRMRRGEPLDDVLGPLEVLDRTRPPRVGDHLRAVLGGVAVGIAGGLAVLAIRWFTGH